MATRVWRGGAPAIAQVQNYTFAGTWEANDIIRCAIGTVSTDIIAGSTVITTIVDTVVAAWNALSATSYPAFSEITASRSGDDLLLTADTAGVPFTVTLTPLETGGGAADLQTIEGVGVATTGAVTTANSGSNDWSVADNWDADAVPITGDTVYVDTTFDSIYYGLNQSAVTLADLTITNCTVGTIGLPEANANDYPEYRDTYLRVGATLLTIDCKSGRVKVNTGAVATTMVIKNSGAAIETDIPAILWKGTHVSNAIDIVKGNFGAAVLPGEVATILTLKIGYVESQDTDADVYCGLGVTFQAGGSIIKNGGQLTCNNTTAVIPSITQTAGDMTINGKTNAITALTAYGGSVFYNTAGTLTAGVVGSAATLDLRGDMRAKTVSAIQIYSGGVVYDPAAVVTWTTGLDLLGSGLEDVTLQIGKHRTWTPSAI